MFAKEIQLYVDYFKTLIDDVKNNPKEHKALHTFYENMQKGLDYCRELAGSQPFTGENLTSLKEAILHQGQRLDAFYQSFKTKISTEAIA